MPRLVLAEFCSIILHPCATIPSDQGPKTMNSIKTTILVTIMAGTVLVAGCKKQSEADSAAQQAGSQTPAAGQDVKQTIADQAVAVQKAAADASAQIAA